MLETRKSPKSFPLAICICTAICAFLMPSLPLLAHGGVEKTEKQEKSKKRTISVTSSSHDGDGKTSSVRIVRHVAKSKEAIEQARQALADVVERLQQANSDAERQALEAARDGLEIAIESLERQRINHIVVAPSKIELGEIEAEALESALANLSDYQHDLSGARRDLQAEIEEARREIAEALGDVEMELDLDGDLRTIRIQSLRKAETSLDDYEERHLEALKQAEADLKRERERLQERLQKRVDKRRAEQQKDGKD